MTWIRLDDDFPDHPKVITLSDQAFRTYITTLCYSARYLTDGALARPVAERLGAVLSASELVQAGLWWERDYGWEIASYAEYQSTKEQVEAARQANRERVSRYRNKKKGAEPVNAISNEFLMEPHTHTHTQTHIPTHKDIEIKDKDIPLPRVKLAKEAVDNITNKLNEARAQGINAWNLSKLIEDEWDKLHDRNEIGACIALTVWYVSELLSRPLTSVEIARMGQMTKRFGRIALLAIDEAASKDLDDLVSYAFRIAQNMYAERKSK